MIVCDYCREPAGEGFFHGDKDVCPRCQIKHAKEYIRHHHDKIVASGTVLPPPNEQEKLIERFMDGMPGCLVRLEEHICPLDTSNRSAYLQGYWSSVALNLASILREARK